MRFLALALIVLMIAPVAGASPQFADLSAAGGESADMCHTIPCCPVFGCSYWGAVCGAIFGPTYCPWW